MLKIVFFAAAIMFFQNTFSQVGDVEILKKMNSDWIYSGLTKDTSVTSKIFADDMVLINAGGRKMTKRELLENATKQQVLSVNIDSVDVRLITNDVGLVTAYLTFSFSSGNGNEKGRNCYQDVYVKRKNRWYAVAAHVTDLTQVNK
ncbi:MAG TPA: nuclear transport factor 2 family protein [Puia sp.]|nr:nuclear transport factor 2 family protein [Puia sp.]